MWRLLKYRLMDMKMVKNMAASVAIIFLIIHICYFQLFFQYGVTPMVYFNIFSMVFYIVMIPLAYKEFFRAFTCCVYLEVVVHMSVAIYFTGWNNGFQISLVGICILAFFAEYVDKYMKTAYLHALPLCFVGLAAYLIMCAVSHFHAASYILPPEVSFRMELLMGAIVFVIMLFFLNLFLLLSTRYEDALSEKADHDQLTGLPNRYCIWDRLSKLDRESGLDGYWIAMIDIDNFKSINDQYGHNTGDVILKELAAIMEENSSDVLVSRWGGEEYLLLGNNYKGAVSDTEVLENLRTKVMDYCFKCDGKTLHITITAGLARYQAGLSLRDWIGAADEKLYLGKKNGKNRIEL